MMPKSLHRIALAIGAGAFMLAAPLAQASGENAYNPKKADKFNEKLPGATPGGTLWVADPTRNVTITLLMDDSLFHINHNFYWYDYNNAKWRMYNLQDSGVHAIANLTRYQRTLTITPTTNQVAFAIGIEDKVGEEGFYIFGTGNGSLDKALWLDDPRDAKYFGAGKPHSVVYYNYRGPENLTKEANVALIGFEDTVTFYLKDYDDIIFMASNISSVPVVPKIPVAQVPEPEAYAMLLAGLGLVGAVVRRRREGGKA
ncbi:MAG: PEP-CTERM sorting domain-containing protein [Azoarcus sp.]|jgi:hypothetical protein|nr:PEP-CTERM sorting domain-containing protein [Azoarcus sp.]